MNYSDGAMEEACAKEKLFDDFFQNVKATLRSQSPDAAERWDAREIALNAALMKAREDVYSSLCDDFDTEGAMSALETLVRAYNKYMENETCAVSPLVTSVGGFVTYMFRVFGLIDPDVKIGFSKGEGAADEETVLTPVVNILSEFRCKGE